MDEESVLSDSTLEAQQDAHSRHTAVKEARGGNDWVHFVAGGTAGFVSALVTCPLEVVKTRLQSAKHRPDLISRQARAGPPSLRAGVSSTFGDIGFILREIYRTEGARGLWRGIGPTLVGIVPARTVYFGFYNLGKEVYAPILDNGVEGTRTHLAAAATAGTSASVLTNPIWLIKTRMQLQKGTANDYKNSFDCLRRVLKEEGVRGLYKGLGATLIGVSESTIQWAMYEQLKKRIRARHPDDKRYIPDELAYFFGAGISKLTAACIAYPHEVLRTRMRERDVDRYRTISGAVRLIWREEGARAFYAGLSAHMMRVVPSAAIMFFCFEVTAKALKRLQGTL